MQITNNVLALFNFKNILPTGGELAPAISGYAYATIWPTLLAGNSLNVHFKAAPKSRSSCLN